MKRGDNLPSDYICPGCHAGDERGEAVSYSLVDGPFQFNRDLLIGAGELLWPMASETAAVFGHILLST